MANSSFMQKCISTCIISVPFFILLFLFAQYFALTGKLQFSYDFSKESAFVDSWRPLGRAMDRQKNLRTGDSAQRIIGEPVYMDVTVPRSFDTVDITVEYKNPNHSLLEFGLVTNTEPYAVRLQPFQSTVIDEALFQWNVLNDPATGLTLLQREEKFNAVSSFVAQPPRNAKIVTYNASLPYTYIDPNYTASNGGITIDRLLRGSHQYVVYAANEDLNATWSVVDMNREFNDDTVHIEVLQNGVIIAETWLQDDGDVTASNTPSTERSVSIRIPLIARGVYEYRISTTNDIVLTKMKSDQEKIVVKNSLTVINSAEFINIFPQVDTSPTVLLMSGRQLRAQTDHPSGLQTITIDRDTLTLDEIHKPTWWETEPNTDTSTVRTVTLPLNDVTITTQGFFAFNDDSYFDPNDLIAPLNELTSIDDIDYILYSNYTAPQETNRSVTQRSTLSLEGVAGNRKKLTFVFSAPGLDRQQHELDIERMEFVFRREPLWKRLQQRFFSSL